MRAFLSIFLSGCLLFNSLVPAFAGVRPHRKKGHAAPVTRYAASKNKRDSRLKERFYKKQASPKNNTVVTKKEEALSPLLKVHSSQKQAFPLNKVELSRVIENAAREQRETLQDANAILETADASKRAQLLRRDFAQSVLVYQTPLARIREGVTFLKQDLAQKGQAVENLAPESLDSFIERDDTQDALDAIAAASSLAAIGTPEDIPALLHFYNQAAQGPLASIAQVITARGLLHMGAYEQFNDWVKTVETAGDFWQELALLAREDNLPISFEAKPAKAEADPAELEHWLKQAGSLHRTHAFTSREITRLWPFVTGEKKASKALPKEEAPANEQIAEVEDDPKLHEASQIKTVSDGLLDYMQEVSSADEVEGVTDQLVVDFAKDGFLMTLEKDGKEQILPVSLRISNRFLNRNWDAFWANHSETPYNRVVIKPEPRLKRGDYELEMRNKTRTPSRMDHFYFRLQKDQVGLLVDMLNRAGVEKFQLKLEANPKNFYRHVELPVYREGTLQPTPLVVSVPEKRYKKGDKLVLLQSGELGWLSEGATQAVAVQNLYVRLPKHQMTELVKVLEAFPEGSTQKLNLSIRPTSNGANFISTSVSMSNLSLGKTFGPMVHGPLNISEKAATDMMFGINYVLPGLASLLTPMLKKYGERKMMTISVALSLASGLLATAGGFYGAVTGMTLGPLQKGLFVTSLLSMSISSILKQLTANLLIRANGGEIEYKDAAKDTKVVTQEKRVETPKQLLKRRSKEFAQQLFLPAIRHAKPAKYNAIKEKMAQDEKDVQLSHLIRYNLGFIFKNIGTLAFLALPYGINWVGSLFGADLGLDFSVSFPIYAAFSGYLTWRMFRVKLRDAYSAKNVIDSREAITKAAHKLSDKVATTQGMEEEKREDLVDTKTRALYDAVSAYVLAQQKVGSKISRSELLLAAKKDALLDLKTALKEAQLPKKEIVQTLKDTEGKLYTLDNAFLNMLGMFKVPGVAALAAGMTMATVHEFVVSSSFAGTMNQVIDRSDWANFLVAFTLYAPMIAGRIGGNWLSKKITPGSMYMFCSGLSALGTLMVGLSHGHVLPMIAGAGIASVGMGNYYTQMYNYIMERHEKYRREINSLLALTMAFGGLGAMASPTGLGLTGNPAWDMVFAGGLLGASWLCTRPMFASSSLIKAFKATPFGQKFMRFVQARYEADQNSAAVKKIKQTHQKIKQKRKEVHATIKKSVHREQLIDYDDLDDAQFAQ